MLRIRGHIGEWPVDLSLELDDEDWARLGARLAAGNPGAPAAPAAEPVDRLWQTAQQLLRSAGQMDGPALLNQLQALAGKRLLVRLRHCAQVRVENGPDAPIYHWAE
ncbi:hypothetical protein [Azotobacter beijerinckii]|uniref:Uncharacterized protein n=1 Tax=Azotobacter beijerinckii TaxID=170623 RepID=A0A1I0VZ79_9GAMM|nr:hypothetical protein [Azotobacter beijerinckii]SFA81193.1 hypothetical protein SAMN04244571_00410 [Azotobacter beijerinckii]